MPRTTVKSRGRGRRTVTGRGRAGRAAKLASSRRQLRYTALQRPGRPLRTALSTYNAEVSSQEMAPISIDLRPLEGNEFNGPKNCHVALGGLYQYNPAGGAPWNEQVGLKQGTDCDEVQGCWITECYPSIFKYRISFADLTVDPNGVFPAVNVRVIHGLYLNTLAKLEATIAATPGHAITIGLQAIKKELYNSAISADHLSFPERNRRVKILSDKVLKPQSLQFNADQAQADFKSHPPPMLGRFSFPHNKMKQKLAKVATPGAAGRNLTPYHSWIPFTVFMCDELLPNAQGQPANGTLKIEYSSKYYFRDT